MSSPDLPDTPQLVFQLLAGPEHRIDYVRSSLTIPEITFDLFKQAVLPSVEESFIGKAHQKLRERGILIDEGWKETNFGVGEQEEETKVKLSASF
ncbi:hypothetical protein C8R41DRAFT_823328 [Lentinula lateritia]|uniref:Uncharacterized protein n=1 Tax=Lentinula lateritia TaxID=40482 RepID=A0ABQ8VL42_9AGAR|nr:hypothetical protein C8R41DRAFT_823328 [Lentinula lateritia]